MKTTTVIKITTVTLILLIVGFILSKLTINNYTFDWSFGTAVCANVCILCGEIERKKMEDAAEESATTDNTAIG